MLRTQFEMELLVYTQDRTFNNWSDCKKVDEERKPKKVPHEVQSFSSTRDNRTTLQELIMHLKPYYKVSFFFSEGYIIK